MVGRWAAQQQADAAKEAAGRKPFRPPSPQKRATSAQGGEFFGTISGYYPYIPVRCAGDKLHACIAGESPMRNMSHQRQMAALVAEPLRMWDTIQQTMACVADEDGTQAAQG